MGQEYFKWSNVYETGFARIDTQHKVILKILNELYEVVLINKQDEKLTDILHELVQYTIYHFDEEEKLFSKYGYIEIEEEEHKRAHEDFVRKITDFKNRLDKNTRLLTVELIDFLKDWLIDHILVEDQKYAEYFKKKGIQI
jgi:hemerythrin-like metal-binding protein